MYVGESFNGAATRPSNKMEHLTCFVPGMLALGHYHGIETGVSDFLSRWSLFTNLCSIGLQI